MNITFKNRQTRKFQVGGTMGAEAPVEEPTVEGGGTPVEEPAPAEGQEQDPLMMLAQLFMQGLQNQDCQMLAQGAQAFLEIVQQMQGGAPAEAQGEPVFRKGGVLVRRIKK